MAVGRVTLRDHKRVVNRPTPTPAPAPVSTGTDVDFLLEIPNLGLADGYGQSARSIVRMLIEICEEEGKTIRIVNRRNLCSAIDREQEFYTFKPLLIEPNRIGHVKVFLRYALPENWFYNADKKIAMTMFESDRVPPEWVPSLNLVDLIITPTEWGVQTFKKWVKPPVVAVPLPVNINYHKLREPDELYPGGVRKFRFITVGNYFQPDRKRLIPLIEEFGKNEIFQTFSDQVELYVKSSWTDRSPNHPKPIDKIAAKYPNVKLELSNISTEELVKLYLSSDCALFPSMGEGFGLPHIEIALLGRPLIVADNSSMSSLKDILPWAVSVGCKTVPADYSPQLIKNAGYWQECDMKEFVDAAAKLFVSWRWNGQDYAKRLIASHRDEKFRTLMSHHTIKEQFRAAIMPLFGD